MSLETITKLTTEATDPTLSEIDQLTITDRCRLQNKLDQTVALAVEKEIKSITTAVDMIVSGIRQGGRLIYVGAGTSGRLGVLDASECPPTFGTDPNLVIGLIAGGNIALTSAVEGSEDDRDAGESAIREAEIKPNDTVVGITASGRTPYVLAALEEAKVSGAQTIGVTNNRPSEIALIAELTIAVITGPEFIAGSTRLKAGTAQKLVLNMLTTQSMVELGKTYGNLMVDVMATNEKLKRRAFTMVKSITDADDQAIIEALTQSSGSAKLAICMLKSGLDLQSAKLVLSEKQGSLRKALELVNSP